MSQHSNLLEEQRVLKKHVDKLIIAQNEGRGEDGGEEEYPSRKKRENVCERDRQTDRQIYRQIDRQIQGQIDTKRE